MVIIAYIIVALVISSPGIVGLVLILMERKRFDDTVLILVLKQYRTGTEIKRLAETTDALADEYIMNMPAKEA